MANHSYNFTDSNATSVRNGTKTRTRRGMSPQPIHGSKFGIVLPIELSDVSEKLNAASAKGYKSLYFDGPLKGMVGPKRPVQQGDIIMVRERHRIAGWDTNGNWTIEFPDGDRIAVQGGLYLNDDEQSTKEWEQIHRMQNWCEKKGIPLRMIDGHKVYDLADRHLPWRQPQFHPHKAVRTFLEVKDCQPTRLGDMTEQQAIAEGVAQVELNGVIGWMNYRHSNAICASPIDSFRSLWTSIHGEYEPDQFVWDIEFARVEKPVTI